MGGRTTILFVRIVLTPVAVNPEYKRPQTYNIYYPKSIIFSPGIHMHPIHVYYILEIFITYTIKHSIFFPLSSSFIWKLIWKNMRAASPCLCNLNGLYKGKLMSFAKPEGMWMFFPILLRGVYYVIGIGIL